MVGEVVHEIVHEEDEKLREEHGGEVYGLVVNALKRAAIWSSSSMEAEF
jgi:hypothetical protein